MHARYIKCIKVESFLCRCLYYLMMSTIEYCICLTVDIILKQSSQYIFLFSFFFFFIILLDLYRIFLDYACFLFFFLLALCNFSARRCLLKYVLTTARYHRASSFDINRAAVCHFHISSCIRTRNELSSICFSN
jgi:hypothetical protein